MKAGSSVSLTPMCMATGISLPHHCRYQAITLKTPLGGQ